MKKDSKEVAMKRKEEKYDVEASGNMAGEVSTEVVEKKCEDDKKNQVEESKEVTEKKCEDGKKDGVETETITKKVSEEKAVTEEISDDQAGKDNKEMDANKEDRLKIASKKKESFGNRGAINKTKDQDVPPTQKSKKNNEEYENYVIENFPSDDDVEWETK